MQVSIGHLHAFFLNKMVAKDTKRKGNRKNSSGTSASRKRTSLAGGTKLKKTTVKGKTKSKAAEDYNTPFMKKIIIITVLLAVLAAGLAVWSFMKIKGLTVYDILSSAL